MPMEILQFISKKMVSAASPEWLHTQNRITRCEMFDRLVWMLMHAGYGFGTNDTIYDVERVNYLSAFISSMLDGIRYLARSSTSCT